MAYYKPYHKWILTFATGIMIFLANVDVTIVNLGLPAIGRTYQAGLSQLQWVITSYLIAAFVCFIMGGRLADMYGKKNIFLLGALLFTLGCFGAALSPNLLTLDWMRFIQGVGFAFTLSLAILINAEAFPDHQQGLSVGISITITGIAQAIGPTLGGIILEWANWRYLFAYVCPLGILSFCLTLIYAKQDELSAVRASFLKGILDPNVWRNRAFIRVTIIRVFYMFSWAVVLFAFPLYLQESRGYSPLFTGLILLMMTAMIGLVSPITGFVMDKVGHRLPMFIAAVLSVISFMILINVSASTPLWQIAVMLFIFGIASGLMIPASVRGAMYHLPAQGKGMGMGVFFTANFMMSALGIALATVILNTGITHQLHGHVLLSAEAFRWVIWLNLALAIGALCVVRPIKFKYA